MSLVKMPHCWISHSATQLLSESPDSLGKISILPMTVTSISALLSYHGDGLSRSDSPSSALSILHGKDLPDLLDARIKHFLDTGHVKVVWGKIVQVSS